MKKMSPDITVTILILEKTILTYIMQSMFAGKFQSTSCYNIAHCENR